MISTLNILGIPVAQLSRDEALAELERLAEHAVPAHVAYVNAHSLNVAARDAEYFAVLRRAPLILNDGSGVALAGRLWRQPFPANLNGTDLTPRVLELAARKNWSVYFLGGRPGVAERAAFALRERIPSLRVAGARDGFFPPNEAEQVAAHIQASGAQVLLVALGNPLQEKWLDRHLMKTGARLGMGVGAFFDFAAGEVTRAPRWMQSMGIEWTYRLFLEPSRMWRRYVVGNPLFLARVLRDRILGMTHTS